MNINFDNTYAALPSRFYSPREPEPVSAPQTIKVNDELARRLGFDPRWLRSEQGAQFIVGNELLEGSEPIAMVYAGHQFGNWVPRLGDGRALLLGEVVADDGQRFDIQLKGSGRTPYSRSGDGRAPLGPVLREYLVAEAMAALGVPTTRALAAASTGDTVLRERALPGAVLVRVAKSHIRIGTFEYFASQGDAKAIALLLNHTMDRHYPELQRESFIALLDAFADRLAELVARWQLLGFIHGVMNTDNMLLSGETVDYGPCAFMNEYDPETVFSSIDRYGRYAYGNQPAIAQWNLSRLAQSLLVAVGAEADSDEAKDIFLNEAQAVVDAFPDRFRKAYRKGMARKLGLGPYRDEYWPLIEDLLGVMADTRSDYTLTFRRLMAQLSTETEHEDRAEELFSLDQAFDPWLARLKAHLDDAPLDLHESLEMMAAENPVFIPRNYLVEEALQEAAEHQDYTAFHELHDVLSEPFTYRSAHHRFALPPEPDQCVGATFCGT